MGAWLRVKGSWFMVNGSLHWGEDISVRGNDIDRRQFDALKKSGACYYAVGSLYL